MRDMYILMFATCFRDISDLEMTPLRLSKQA